MSERMDFDDGRSERQAPPFNSYQAGYQDPFMGSYGQKLSTPDVQAGGGASVGQRLALAIVSVVMLVPLSGIVLGTTHDDPITLVGGLIALGLICLTIMVVNIAFSWRR